MDPSKGVAENIAELDSLVAKLEAVGEKTADEDYVAKVISCLPSSFRSFVSAWNLKDERTKTKEVLLASLLQEETTSMKYEEETEEESAFHANRRRTHGRQRFSGSGGNGSKTFSREGSSGSKSNDNRCFRSNQTGHFKRDCRNKLSGSDSHETQTSGGKMNNKALTASSKALVSSLDSSRDWNSWSMEVSPIALCMMCFMCHHLSIP